jgi:predicted TIM-barrel fold metal-dependent hydrolase
VKGANELVPDKALYASAFPFINFETAIARYRDLPFKAEVRPQVMGGNAARLLGISQPALPR